MGKYPSKWAYIIAIQDNKYVVAAISKYNNHYYGKRYATEEEANVERDSKNKAIEDVKKHFTTNVNTDEKTEPITIKLYPKTKTTFSEFFWTFDRAGVLMVLLASLIYMIFHNETRVENTGFYVSWIVCHVGVIILAIAYFHRDWNRVND